MSFAKLDSGIIHSSIWSEDYATRLLWVTMLAMKDESGFVGASRSGLMRAANISADEFDVAITCLESPDRESRTEDYDGRRVEKIEGGWVILNHEKYRLKEDLRREQTRDRVKRHREKNKTSVTGALHSVTPALHGVTGALPSVSVSKSVSVSEERGSGGKVESVADEIKRQMGGFDIDSAWEVFWFNYPKKEQREAAKQVFYPLLENDRALIHSILKQVKEYDFYCRMEYDDYPNSRFIKLAKNWLNDKLWTEDWGEKANRVKKDAPEPKKSNKTPLWMPPPPDKRR